MAGGGGFDAPETGGGRHKQKKYKKGKGLESYWLPAGWGKNENR